MSHQYRDLPPEQMEELFSRFLVNSWSYSRVTTFARNEKAFEMSYIFGLKGKSSATTVAGQAYHEALQMYFKWMKEGKKMEIVDMEAIAFNYIDDFKAHWWKLQKTTPTVDECKAKAIITVNTLIKNFLSEIGTYIDDIDEVLEIETSGEEFLTINGVDIPLPCHYIIDLVVRTKSGAIAIVDHKSKSVYTDEDEIGLSIGVQAITYIKCYESRTGGTVDEVWFIENKYSQNKDKTPQLRKFKVEIDDDTRKLYEALLYEPLRKMISAVNDPDYVYIINDNDNFIDRAEMYDFWCRTQISEVDDFNIDESKREVIGKRLKKIRDASSAMISPSVIKHFKENAASFISYDLSHTNMTSQEKIEHVLRSFGIIVRVAHSLKGYSSDTFLLEVSAGVKISSILSHRLDIANAIDVSNVRFSENLVVYEGKSYLSVDFAKKRESDLIFDPSELLGLRLPLGKDNFGKTIAWNLDNQSTPHVLICGATGSGKSVCVESTIEYALQAGINDIVILDPKYEFTDYGSRRGVSVFNDIIEIELKMIELIEEMNARVKSGTKKTTLVIFDEFADALAQSTKGKKLGDLQALEENLRILLQKGRSTGFRIMAATQRASVKVITGDAKVNFPVQICFRVPKETDSRVVLDQPGAESLAGAGDGLIHSPEYPELVRFQAYYKPRIVNAQVA